MCGICGVIQVGGRPRALVLPDVLDRMTDVMTHRGPDDRGVLLEDGIALGVRRLSIVDVEGGHQPFVGESGDVWAVQNGELYNHVELRRELEGQGHSFRTRCDTEVLPHLYERDGAGLAERLRGKFALAVWDRRRRTAVLARDRLGIKPLYWAEVDGTVVFASELKSLLASGLVGGDLDYEAIDAYLTFGFFPGPSTPLAAVSKLLPGHRLVVAEERVVVEPYWSYPRPAPVQGKPAEEWADELLAGLEDSVRCRLMSDVPLGAMLSGGIDSSLVTALMARNMAEPVKTFSIGFVEDGDRNELADARLVAGALGAEHHELELSVADAAVDVETLVWQLDEPLADLSALGLSALSELASRHVTVALCGQGADELLGGYDKHRAAAGAARWRRLPRSVRAAGSRLARHGPGSVQRAARTLAADGAVDRLLAMSSRLDDGMRASLLRGPLAELDGRAAHRVVADRLGDVADDPLPATLYIDAQLALVDDMLHYFDRVSMAHSLEVRTPFLDHHLVELCATVPADLKVRRLTTKYLLRRAAKGLIPAHVVEKPKVAFFAASVDRWFAAQADGVIADYLLAPSPRYADFLDRGAVADLVAGHSVSRDLTRGRLLLAILMLEVWLATYLPRATTGSR